MTTFIQITDRTTLRVEESQFFGSEAEAQVYTANANKRVAGKTFAVVTRPAEDLASDLHNAATGTLAAIDAYFAGADQ